MGRRVIEALSVFESVAVILAAGAAIVPLYQYYSESDARIRGRLVQEAQLMASCIQLQDETIIPKAKEWMSMVTGDRGEAITKIHIPQTILNFSRKCDDLGLLNIDETTKPFWDVFFKKE